MKKLSGILAIVLSMGVFLPSGYSQNIRGFCGTERLDLVKQALVETKAAHANSVFSRQVIKYIPVKFHLVANAAGTGRVTEDKVYEVLCALNAKFASMNLQFYIKDGFNYFNHDVTFDNPKSNGAGIKMQGQRDIKALNIYIVNKIEDDNGGTTLGYFDPQNDWLVFLKNQVSKQNESTLEHEIGHFFSLLHTFDGWECEPYDVNVHGEQVGKFAPCSSLAPPYNAVENELASGANCAYAGDLICDTPADYNFGFGWPTGDCNFTDVVLDYLGQAVNPMENNMMGYFIGCDDYFFTPQQQDIVFANYATANNRQYIRTNYIPANLSVNGEAILNSPGDDVIVETFDSVLLTWNAPVGADRYAVVLNRVFNNAVLSPATVIVTNTNQLLLSNLNKTWTYQWKVFSYNEYATCSSGSPAHRFTTGTTSSTNDILDLLQGITLSPNPVKANQQLQVSFSTSKTYKADFRMIGMDGQQIGALQSASILPSINAVNLSIRDLQSGLYYLQIITDDGIHSLPFFVTQ